MVERGRPPRLSIGLPVFNGERYLAEAIESLLAQSFSDFELLILDNASTDATKRICADFCSRDQRIRYTRNAANIGAARNFNLAVAQTRAPFFKWAAHDDLCAPEFLERCVEVLEADEGCVLAYPKARIKDEETEAWEDYELRLPTDSADVVERFEALLRGHKCFEVFGVIRRSALQETGLIGTYAHGDGVLLAQLALRGRFQEIPEFLFFPRRHSDQSMAMLGDYAAFAVWFNPDLSRKLVFPHWRIHIEWFKSVWRAPISRDERLQCYRRLYWWAQTRKSALWQDVVAQAARLRRSSIGGRVRSGPGSERTRDEC
jgi:glycosyltransferase involved in cell wall biosynthesis